MNKDQFILLEQWTHQLNEFNRNDLLVHLPTDKIIPYSSTLAFSEVEKIITKAQQFIKESGTNPLTYSKGTLTWEWNNQVISTPIWLFPLHFSIDKVRKLVHVEYAEDEGFLNPFLQKKLHELYELEIASNTFDEAIKDINDAGFHAIDVDIHVIENLHHHRFSLLKELEDLQKLTDFSGPLKQLLSGETTEISNEFPHETLLESDTDQRRVFQLMQAHNVVVQGPPGTGKSQLLTNIIGKSLQNGTSTLVVSEKKAALEVLVNRLYQMNLSTYCTLTTDDLTNKDFIEDLKKTWLHVEQLEPATGYVFPTKKEQENSLQLLLDILNSPTVVGQSTFFKFQTLKEKYGHATEVPFLPDPPALEKFENTLEEVKNYYQHKVNIPLSRVHVKWFLSYDGPTKFKQLERLIEEVELMEPHYPAISINDLDQLQSDAVIYQLYENELAKKHVAILSPDSKEQVKFKSLYQKFKSLPESTIHQSDWKIIPSLIEAKNLQDNLKKEGLIAKFKLKKRWNTLSNLPLEQADLLLKALIRYYENAEIKQKLAQKFQQIGVVNLEELDVIHASIFLFNQQKWDQFNQFTKAQQLFFAQHAQLVLHVKDKLKHHFRLATNQAILSQLNALKQDWALLMSHEKAIQALDEDVLKSLQECSSFETYTNAVIKAHQVSLTNNYPQLSTITGTDIKQRIEAVIAEQATERTWIKHTIENSIHRKFVAYQELLTRNTATLTNEEKKLKKDLQIGKRILIKEFSKTRQHPSIRTLMHSEAALWIRILKPVWLTTPIQLAKTHPLDIRYDIGVLDEASQIPVYNGVGALQRSKRVIIAGDDQQMGPSSYFQAQSSEITSLLQHARFYFKNAVLTHHYRSKHPQLIQFSNRYFYNNELVVYPSYPLVKSAINFHHIPEGRFVDRQNTLEAKKVIELLKEYIEQKKTIGVVAFSQQQVNQIFKELPKDLLQKVQQRILDATLFIKPLEKVQGDECEILLISLAYAPNEEGQLHMKFGPLSTSNGKNRLNVLFSRASESIHFVHSIEADALRWSTNERVQLLAKWLDQKNKVQTDKDVSFPFELHSKISENRVTLPLDQVQLRNAIELVTTVQVLQNRGWQVHLKF